MANVNCNTKEDRGGKYRKQEGPLEPVIEKPNISLAFESNLQFTDTL